MTAHAALIAEKLQGAHERRQRGEDKDMSRDEDRSVWSPEKREVVDTLAESVYDALLKLAEKNAPEPQSNAVSAERVVELERRLADALVQREASDAAANERDGEHEELQQRVANMVERAEAAEQRLEKATEGLVQVRELLATAYVAREVPWSDVAAGMMTISAQGAPFLVTEQPGDAGMDSGTWALTGLHDGKVIRFEKTPKAGETVRVLVPYVTPEQAEKAVADGLGAVRT